MAKVMNLGVHCSECIHYQGIVRLCIAWLYRKEYCYYTQFLFMVIENVIISVDFGHKNDMSVETVFRIDKSRLIILSQKIIGCAKDFDTEEKRNDYLNKERCNL